MNPIRIDIQNNLNRINEILTHFNKLDVTVSKCIWETQKYSIRKESNKFVNQLDFTLKEIDSKDKAI